MALVAARRIVCSLCVLKEGARVPASLPKSLLDKWLADGIIYVGKPTYDGEGNPIYSMSPESDEDIDSDLEVDDDVDEDATKHNGVMHRHARRPRVRRER